MVQIPYNNVASERLSATPLPSVGVNAPGAAFGTSIAEALTHVGRAAEGAGNEIFGRAVWLQQRANEAEGNDLYIQADTEAGQLKNKFNSLQGRAVGDALPQYQQDLNGIRQKYLANAPNLEIARNFDKDFKRRVGFMLIDGGSYAAAQTRVANNQSYAARRELSNSSVADNPTDLTRFDQAVETTKLTIRQQGVDEGWDPEVTEYNERKAVTNLWSARLTSMSRTDPLKARELFEKNSGSMDGITALGIKAKIDQGIITHQSRVDADRIVKSSELPAKAYLDKVKGFEGYSDRAYSDFKQQSIGYGSRYKPEYDSMAPAERKMALEKQFTTDIGKAAAIVDQINPNLPAGTRAALISLTYNTGDKWVTSGLGDKVRSNDLDGAKENFAQYNQAGGQVNQGLVARREAELSWWGKGDVRERGPITASSLAARMEQSYGEAKTRAEELFPGDPALQSQYEMTLRSRIDHEFAGLKRLSATQKQANYESVASALLNEKNPVTRFDDLPPEVQEAYKLLSPVQQQSVMKQISSNIRQSNQETPENVKSFNSYMAMSKLDRSQFMNVDIMGIEGLTLGQKNRLFSAQRGIQSQAVGATNLLHAMSVISPMLAEAGVVKSNQDTSQAKEKNKIYNEFAGEFNAELERRISTGEKLVEKDYREIGARLLARTKVPGLLWGYNEGPMVFSTKAKPIDSVNSKEAFDRLPSGTYFTDPKGVVRRKP